MVRRSWDIIVGLIGILLLIIGIFGSRILPNEFSVGIIILGIVLSLLGFAGGISRLRIKPTGSGFKRFLASYIGITICSKCGTRTKLKDTELFDRSRLGNENWIGYAICPKCGQKDKWIHGNQGLE